MGKMRIAFAVIASTLGLLIVALLIAFGLAQTGFGKAWLARELSLWLSSPAERVTIDGLAGLVPFDMTVRKIEFADRQGPRMVIEDASIAIAPLDLLSRRLTLGLTARGVTLDRLSESSGGMNLADLLRPGFAVDLKALRIGRLYLGPAIFGEPATMRLIASGQLGGGRVAVDIDLRRIDATPGEAKFHLALAGDPLSLDLAANVS